MSGGGKLKQVPLLTQGADSQALDAVLCELFTRAAMEMAIKISSNPAKT